MYIAGIVDSLKSRWNGGKLDQRQVNDYISSDVPMMFSVIEQLQSRVKHLEAVRAGYRERYLNLKNVVASLKWQVSQLKGQPIDPPCDVK